MISAGELMDGWMVFSVIKKVSVDLLRACFVFVLSRRQPWFFGAKSMSISFSFPSRKMVTNSHACVHFYG